ncbi:15895_t:CDS:2, partial [Dentiscutata heterogama]
MKSINNHSFGLKLFLFIIPIVFAQCDYNNTSGCICLKSDAIGGLKCGHELNNGCPSDTSSIFQCNPGGTRICRFGPCAYGCCATGDGYSYCCKDSVCTSCPSGSWIKPSTISPPPTPTTIALQPPSTKIINNDGLNLIKQFESFSPTFYLDPSNIKTIGYGHNCYYDPQKCNQIHPPITVAEGEKLLNEDLITPENAVNNLVKINLNSNQFSALVSLTFNIGYGNFDKSDLLIKLNAGDTKGASAEFGKWAHDNSGNVLQGLVKRREAER